jgi:hypothetical protein
MATGAISSTFDIVITGSGGPNAAGDLNVAKTFVTSRAFDIVGVSCNNIAAGASTLIVLNGALNVCGTTAAPPVAGTAIVQAQADAFGASQTVTIVGGANCNVAAGATITITTGDATVPRVILHCVASGLGEAIAVA